MNHVARGAVVMAGYVLLCVVPLVLALVPRSPEGRGFWMEFSVAIGFVGLAMLGLQFAITGRSRIMTERFDLV